MAIDESGMRNGLELRHLRYFVALADELHFGRAAQVLRVSQPLLSRQIRELERILGVRLLAKTRPTVELTAGGHELYERAQETLRQAEQAVRATRRANGEPDRLVLALEPCSLFHGFTQLLRELKGALPGVQLEVRELPVPEHPIRLRTGEIDLAYAHWNEQAEGIEFLRLDSEPLRAVLPKAHQLARRRRLSFDALREEALVFWPRAMAPACHDLIVQAFTSMGVDFEPKHLASDHKRLLEMVAAGLGWSMAPACVNRARQAGVVYREVERVSQTVDIGVSSLAGSRDQRVRAAIAVIAKSSGVRD